jgi:mono/diheme cytochrome c family protein
MYSCATDSRPDISAEYVELDTITVIDAPDPVPGSYHPAERDKLERGAYLVVLLGCGSCHTNGAFDGAPEFERGLAGSDTGIAFTNPLGEKRPGITYPPNITPDAKTGIGRWSDEQIANAIRAGIGRHGERRIVTMPWQGYSQLTDDDVGSIVSYLRSIKPISKRVPSEVEPGQLATKPFVYFGVYRSKR